MMTADAASRRARTLARMCDPIFEGEDPGVIGAALATLMTILLTGHKIRNDPKGQREMREEILRVWCESVREMLATAERVH